MVEKPFAAYLLTLSLHHPFAGFPSHLEKLDVGIWKGTPVGNFLHTMHFFDASLAAFMADLERGGLADDAVVAIWGDHDAGFEWRPEVASAMGATHDAAGWYLSQEVPLFIRVPNVDTLRGERTVAAGHTDVAPTLLAVLGIDPAAPRVNGVTFETDDSGRYTGVFRGPGAARLFMGAVPRRFSVARRTRQTVRALRQAARYGVTSLSDMSDDEQLRIYEQLHERGELTVRVHFRYGLERWNELRERGVAVGSGDEWIRLGALKGSSLR